MATSSLLPDHLTLATRFPIQARFDLSPENAPVIRFFQGRLDARGIQVTSRVEGSDLILSYELSIYDALCLGDAYGSPAQLYHFLVGSFPGLASDPAALRERIESLQATFELIRRMAS